MQGVASSLRGDKIEIQPRDRVAGGGEGDHHKNEYYLIYIHYHEQG